MRTVTGIVLEGLEPSLLVRAALGAICINACRELAKGALSGACVGRCWCVHHADIPAFRAGDLVKQAKHAALAVPLSEG
jgi:hypothetical protein